jgi:hypothetical protein
MKAAGVREKGVEEKIWAKEERCNRRVKKLHNEELHDLYSSPNIIRVIKSISGIGTTCSTYGAKERFI